MRNLICMAILALCATAGAETLVYKAVFTLKVPRVYANTESKGYRKYQTQVVRGVVTVDTSNLVAGEPKMTACFTNTTHKVAGRFVTYECEVDQSSVMWRWIGDNRKGDFHKPCLRFSAECNPSYNIGDDEPDNTLIFTWSGYGNGVKRIGGYVAGQIGCGCSAYGHVSPTRTIDGRISDIVPMCGKGYIKLSRRIK